MKKLSIYIFFLLFAIGCKEKYVSPVISPVTGYLVVEGVINANQGETDIYLKRTVPLESPFRSFETGAAVSIVGEDNTTLNLKESDSGKYVIAKTTLKTNVRYKLSIRTLDGKTYESDYAGVQKTPAIDSVEWKKENGGIQFYVNTHDPTNSTKYYQWDYTETYEYQSPYLQYFVYKPIIVGYRTTKYILTDFDPIMITFNGLISKCWNTTYSGNIFLTTSVNLSQNRINHPINFIPGGSVKIMELYSILVRQYGLSEGKYNYLEKMKKNTEQTGSVFDAQPSELVGNIHCVSNPSEPVIGYMDISQIQEVRKFIRNKDLPDWNYTPPCFKVEVENNMDSITAVHSTLEPAYVAQYSPRGGILSFYFSTPECIDCRYHGSTIKPSFWPQ